MREVAIAAVAVMALAGQAHAAQKPVGTSADRRVQTVTFDAENVIEVPIVPGIATHIILATDEQMIDYLLGDPKAVTIYRKDNHLWVKPSAPGGSNLSIATDKRSYNFHLRYTQAAREASYQVTLRYPDIEARELRERARAATLGERMAEQPAAANHAYSVTTDPGIAVVDVWDDGLRTHFKFKGEVPVISAVDAAGNPYIVARTMEGIDTAIVHTVAQRWILRLGDGVVRGVVNDAYEQGRASPVTGTVSPGVQRVLKESVK